MFLLSAPGRDPSSAVIHTERLQYLTLSNKLMYKIKLECMQ